MAIVMTGLDQDMMQKNNSCKNIGDAQKNMLSFSVILVFVNLLFVSLGALLYIYADAAQVALPDRTDHVFPALALNHFPTVVGATFIIGLIAAAFSSADSALTALTTSFCVDFLGFEKKSTQASNRSVKTRYLVHLGVTAVVLSVVLIFYYFLEGDVIGDLFRAAGYTYGPLLGLFAFAIFTKRRIKDNFAPIICIISPIACYFLNMYSEEILWGHKIGFEILVYNGMLTFLGLLLISKKRKLEQQRI
jgi:Na+/proline symporter